MIVGLERCNAFTRFELMRRLLIGKGEKEVMSRSIGKK